MAAVGFVSCQTAPGRVEGGAGAASSASNQSETEIPASTVFWVRLEKTLDSSKLKTGDKFSGALAEDVIENGKVVAPKGTAVKGRVTNSQTAQSQGSAGLLSLELDSFTVRGYSYNLKTQPVTLQAAPLKANPPAGVAPAVEKQVETAYAPKDGILQFFLSDAIKIR